MNDRETIADLAVKATEEVLQFHNMMLTDQFRKLHGNSVLSLARVHFPIRLASLQKFEREKVDTCDVPVDQARRNIVRWIDEWKKIITDTLEKFDRSIDNAPANS